MKYFNPKTMKPDLNQFYEAVKGKLSEEGQKSIAYKAVHNLFEQARTLYKTLDFTTNKSLSKQQEEDAITLTAMYVRDLRTQFIHNLVKEDNTLTDADRKVLEMALELYKATCEANYGALGNPRWTDD